MLQSCTEKRWQKVQLHISYFFPEDLMSWNCISNFDIRIWSVVINNFSSLKGPAVW